MKGRPNTGSVIMCSDRTSGTVNSGCPGSHSRYATLGFLVGSEVSGMINTFEYTVGRLCLYVGDNARIQTHIFEPVQ